MSKAIKFERVRPGEYRARRGPVFLWVFREWRERRWWWAIGSHQGWAIWDLDSHHGPFTTRKAAIADALAIHALEGD
jgi:hypothetical protein